MKIGVDAGLGAPVGIGHGLGTWTAKRRAKSPDAVAVVAGSRVWTHRDLADAADAVSARLAALGVADGDAVAHLGENTPELLAVLFGAAQLGAVFVPVNTRLAPPEVAHVLADSGARAVVHDPELAPLLETSLARLGPGARAVSVLTAPEAAVVDASLPGWQCAAVGLDHPAAVIYTSGTTGRAKGAVLTHGNLTWAALNAVVDYDITSADVALVISPLFHVASLGMGALPSVLVGAAMVLERRFEPGRALDLVERHRVTMLNGVPTTFQLLADHERWAATDLSSLTRLTCGGSAVPPRVIAAYEERGLHFSQGYGMTETSPGATSLAPAMTRAKGGSVGLPHFFTQVRVADATGTPLPAGQVGEVQVAGPNVFAGYLGQPEATAAAFTPDGWFRSGDLGSLDDDGYLTIADRLKDMIISGGENVYPAEVEGLLAELPGVLSVAVIAVPDERWGEVPCAVVALAEGASLDLPTVQAHLAGRLARYKVPKRLVVVDSLPATASGKIRKADLRARYATPLSP